MFYREAGQFKSSYDGDQQIFPIRQDRIAFAILLAVAFLVVPLVGNQYWFSAILTPFLVAALATIGLNILTGYAGQLSLGTAAFIGLGDAGPVTLTWKSADGQAQKHEAVVVDKPIRVVLGAKK